MDGQGSSRQPLFATSFLTSRGPEKPRVQFAAAGDPGAQFCPSDLAVFGLRTVAVPYGKEPTVRNHAPRPAFSLVELLVALTVVLVLMSLVGSAVSAARTSQKMAATRSTIDKIALILTTHLDRYDAKPVPMTGIPSGISKNAYRAWFVRRNMISGDMPDRWADVKYMADNAATFRPDGLSAAQRTYVNIWNGLSASQKLIVPQQYGSSECLFMAVMNGGLADCLNCMALKTSDVGDKDGDGMMEFWDAWQNPIEFLLWAPAVELPAGSGTKFFSGSRSLDDAFPSSGTVRLALGMKPLIYSAGPDGLSGIERASDAATLALGSSPTGRNCGNPLDATVSRSGGLALSSTTDPRQDNVTNLDLEARQ